MSPLPYEAGKKKDLGTAPPADDRVATKKVDDALTAAISKQASDVHFEPQPDGLHIRLRVAGLMEYFDTVPTNMAHYIINRLKVLSAMDITKTRIAQDGYFKIGLEQPVEVYSFVFPSLYGERITLKLQYKRQVSLNLTELGMQQTMLESLQKAASKPNGLILVVGPPGNGKTTTLFALMNYLSSPAKNMMSFETVIKYTLPSLLQGKPDEKADFGYAAGVKAMMQQEPDIALIGEVQELDVARAVIHAGFAKRIVLARVTANNCFNAINYLIDMGIQPFLVTSALNAVLSQRLVRKLCEHCKEPFTPSPALLAEIGYKLRPDIKFYKAVGCDNCQQKGYSGLTGIFELLVPNETISELIIAREPAKTVLEAAANFGFAPLKKDGIIKAASGITTVEEVLNVV